MPLNDVAIVNYFSEATCQELKN